MRTLRIYFLLTSFPYITQYHTVHPVPTYLTTGSLYLLTIFLQFLLPQPSASGNHKSDLFFYEFCGL